MITGLHGVIYSHIRKSSVKSLDSVVKLCFLLVFRRLSTFDSCLSLLRKLVRDFPSFTKPEFVVFFSFLFVCLKGPRK